jgi:hypothetical protein
MRWLLDAYLDGRTYTSLAYLLLALPLGIVGFTVVVTGLATGVGLLVTLAGIPVLVATLMFTAAYARLQRRLAWSLLDAPMPRSMSGPDPSGGIFWRRLHRLLTRPGAGREVWFALLSLPLGVIGFAVAMSIVWLMVAGFVQPVQAAMGLPTEIGLWTVDTVDTFAETLVFIPVSVLFWFVGPRLLLGFGTVMGRVITGVLGRVETPDLKRGVVDVLTRTGVADGFTILDDLRLRFGRGPFVTPVQVAATLLALEGRGTIRADRRGQRTFYRLA